MLKDRENENQQNNSNSSCLVIVLLNGDKPVRQIGWEAVLRIRETDE